MNGLEEIEKKQNIKFPEEYKRLYQSEFNNIDSSVEIHAGDDVFCIRKFLTAIEIHEVLEEFYDLFGYDIVPIAETDDDNYICLYYRENTKSPSIIYWNYELALENPEECILFLYDSIYGFETKLMQK